MVHFFQKNNLPEKFLRGGSNKGCKYVCKETYGNQWGELLCGLGDLNGRTHALGCFSCVIGTAFLYLSLGLWIL